MDSKDSKDSSEFKLELEYFEDPAQIHSKTTQILQSFQATLTELESFNLSRAKFNDSILKFSQKESEYQKWLWTCELMAKVGATSEARKASGEAISKLKQFLTDIWVNEKLSQLFLACHDQDKEMDDESKRVLQVYLNLFKRNGATLNAEQRKEFGEVSNQISTLSIEFLATINEDTSCVELTEAELEGMTEDYKSSLKKTPEGKRIVTMKYPDVLPFMRQCKNAEARRKVSYCFDNRGADKNLDILAKIVRLRAKLASMLGYSTFADYVLESKMAGSTHNVEEFTQNLIQKLKPLAQKELAELLSLKKEEVEKRGEPFDGRINNWDLNYYLNVLKEKRCNFNEEKVREYFPTQIVMEKLFEIYQTLLGLKFIKSEPSKKWHQDVLFYRVYDVEKKEYIGVFYLDLFPRPGKYSHACAFPVVDGLVNQRHAIAAMVANFTKATANKPSLLTHSEVVTFFHELGHIMHNLCARAKHARTTWFNVEMDFVEAPSQMLENWCWQKDILKSISSHFATGEPLPDDLIDSVIRTKNIGDGLIYLRQIFMGEFDLTIHRNPSLLEKSSLTEIWHKLKEEIALIPATPGTNTPSTFMHMCAGYEVGYYGYLWSEVFSTDMFSVFQTEGVLNPNVGKRYRTCILEPGAKQTGMQMLINFLGRKPSLDAFLKEVGISV